jgi:excisionase family DNA binding protein
MDNLNGNLQDQALIKKLLKGDDVAEILNISRSLAYLLMRRGEISTIKIGRTVRVRYEDLLKFIKDHVSH